MRIADIRRRLAAAGARPIHAERMLRAWTRGLPLDHGPVPAADCLPAALRAALPALGAELDGLARVRAEHSGDDGSARLLLDLADGQTVESVLLPRDGVCVSTQVGCAVGCRFCMTGRSGLQRQLGSAEIVAQVVLARRRRKVGKVVFMGMGEPAHNMDNVLDAIDLLGTAGGIGHKNLVFSTVGDRRVFRAPAAGQGQAGAGAVAAHDQAPSCARSCCPRRSASIRRNWSNSPTPTRAPPAIQCNTNGHCSKASTTATTNWMPSSACSRASTR
jgi:23S rRNA (adenine2503-C2)-methyltransferase